MVAEEKFPEIPRGEVLWKWLDECLVVDLEEVQLGLTCKYFYLYIL